jgi:hypothetical protein
MSTPDHYLAICLANKNSPRMAAWNALPEAERNAKMQEGVAAWHAWSKKYGESVVMMGGPLGKTSGFTIVRASSHEEAARMFENHPHFTIFPGDAVEVMPILPIPGV